MIRLERCGLWQSKKSIALINENLNAILKLPGKNDNAASLPVAVVISLDQYELCFVNLTIHTHGGNVRMF